MRNTHFPDNNPDDDDEDRSPRSNPLLIILVVIIFATIFLSFTSSIAKSAEAPKTPPSEAPPPKPLWKPPVAKIATTPLPVDKERAKEIAEKWGVELISLRLTAAGYMIDFRFRVLDEKKAISFFDSRIKPLLVVEKSNAKLPVPMAEKVGALRPTNRGKNIHPNKIYYMVFGNPDAHVKPGEKVTMIIGDFKAEHLIVH